MIFSLERRFLLLLLLPVAVILTDRIQATPGGGKVVISGRTYDAIPGFLKVSLEFKARLKGVGEIQQLHEIESVNGDLQSKQKPIYPGQRKALYDRAFRGGTTIRVHYVQLWNERKLRP